MARKKLFGAKGPLIYATMVSLVCVMAASISTFAWFQAEARVQVQTTSTSTNITVNKPDDYTFYAYKGNVLSTWSPNNSFNNDFVSVTSSNLNQYTSFSNFVPGQSYIYAVKVQQTTSLSIAITKIISNDAGKQGIAYRRTTYEGGNAVNVGWAIDIFEYDVVTTHDAVPSYANYSPILSKKTSDSDYPDRFNFTEANAGSTLSAAGTGSAPNKVITLGSSIGIYDNSNSSLNYGKTTTALNASTDIFVFFSVVYSDSNSTYYKEVKSRSDDSEIIVSPTASERFFKKDTNGNSNCYAGLKFALSEITIDIG